MPLLSFGGHSPKVPGSVWIAPDAWVIGDSELGDEVSAFFGTVIRGDIEPIRVGAGTNLQEGVLLHTSTGLTPCVVGMNVTVGHHAIIHGCKIGNNCVIGMGSTILDGAEIGDNCILGANSLVTMNTKIQSGWMAFGSPAKAVRPLSPEELKSIPDQAKHYRELARAYAKTIRN